MRYFLKPLAHLTRLLQGDKISGDLVSPDLIRRISEAPPEIPRGWFRCLHLGRLAWYPWDFELKLETEWRKLDFAVRDGAITFDDELLAQTRRHAWQVGRLRLQHLVEHAWPDLDAQERGHLLAGLSNGTLFPGLEAPDDGIFEESPKPCPELDRECDWMVAQLANAELSAEMVAEIACNAIRRHRAPMLSSVLLHGRMRLNETVDRMDSHGRWARDTDWKPDLEPLSDRVIDLILEAAILRCWPEGVRQALDHGADPNLHIWSLEGCSNEHDTSLGWLFNSSRAGGEGSRLILDLLLGHPDLKPGPTHAKALWGATGYRGSDNLAMRMIERGIAFETKDQPSWLKDVGTDQEIDWAKCYWLSDKKEFLKRATEVAPLLPVTPSREASWFESASSMGSSWYTPLSRFMHDVQLERLQRYAALGLPLKLTIPDLAQIIQSKAGRCLEWLMEQWQIPLKVRAEVMWRLFAIRPYGASVTVRDIPDISRRPVWMYRP